MHVHGYELNIHSYISGLRRNHQCVLQVLHSHSVRNILVCSRVPMYHCDLDSNDNINSGHSHKISVDAQ